MKKYTFIICLFWFLFQEVQGQMQSFDYKNFDNTSDFKLKYYAQKYENKVRLTSSRKNQKGGLWYHKEMLYVDYEFETQFTFQISNAGGAGGGADGIALLIYGKNVLGEVGDLGGGIGYDGVPNTLAIELDTYNNAEGSNNHIAIHSKGTRPNSTRADGRLAVKNLSRFDDFLKDGKKRVLSIKYKSNTMKVFLDNRLILSHKVNIRKLLKLDNGKAWVGLTAATGDGYAKHDILAWQWTGKSKDNEEIVNQEINNSEITSNKEIKNPEEINKRKINYVHTIKVKSADVRIQVWDNKTQDGDTISLNLNGKWVVENQALFKRKKEFKVKLNKGHNFFVLHAKNLGKIPPNTASIAIIDEKRRQVFILSSDMKQSQAMNIEFE